MKQKSFEYHMMQALKHFLGAYVALVNEGDTMKDSLNAHIDEHNRIVKSEEKKDDNG